MPKKMKETYRGLDKYSEAKIDSATEKKVIPKAKPKDFYEGEGYKGSPDMYPDYEEDKKDIKEGRKPQHMGSKYGGSIKKLKLGGFSRNNYKRTGKL